MNTPNGGALPLKNTVALLDKARALCLPPTDYQLAKRLGVSPQRLSNWRRGQNAPDTMTAWKLAHLLGMSPADVIAYIEEDRATDEERRRFWKAQLPRGLAIAVAAYYLAAHWGSLSDGSGVVSALVSGAIQLNNSIHQSLLITSFVLASRKPSPRNPPTFGAAA